MVNYLQKFAPNLSEATAPMRELLKEEKQFLWDEEVQGRSFKRVKQLIVESPVVKRDLLYKSPIPMQDRKKSIF